MFLCRRQAAVVHVHDIKDDMAVASLQDVCHDVDAAAAAAAPGDTPLLYIAREGHYKYPPAEIPALLIQSGANMEAKDSSGKTALQVSLL